MRPRVLLSEQTRPRLQEQQYRTGSVDTGGYAGACCNSLPAVTAVDMKICSSKHGFRRVAETGASQEIGRASGWERVDGRG